MLDSGIEGAVFAVLAAVLGLGQALLFSHDRRLLARLFDRWTVYFAGHFVIAIVLFCVWKIPSPLTNRHIPFQLLLECAWIEGVIVVMSLCLRIVFADTALRAMFCCVAAVTVLLHMLGFLLLVLDQDNWKSILFGASLPVPISLLVAFFHVWWSDLDRSCKPIAILVYSLLNAGGLVVSVLTIRDADKFLQANVILITVFNLIPVSLPLVKAPRIFGEIRPRCPRQTGPINGMMRRQSGPAWSFDDPSSDISHPFGTEQRHSVNWSTPSLKSEPGTSNYNEFRSPSPLLPAVPGYPCPSYGPAHVTTHALPTATPNTIQVATEVNTTVGPKQENLPELETWISANSCPSWM